jgi:hypothetical protein
VRLVGFTVDVYGLLAVVSVVVAAVVEFLLREVEVEGRDWAAVSCDGEWVFVGF